MCRTWLKATQFVEATETRPGTQLDALFAGLRVVAEGLPHRLSQALEVLVIEAEASRSDHLVLGSEVLANKAGMTRRSWLRTRDALAGLGLIAVTSRTGCQLAAEARPLSDPDRHRT